MNRPPLDSLDLAEQATWLRALARSLVRDAALAEDLERRVEPFGGVDAAEGAGVLEARQVPAAEMIREVGGGERQRAASGRVVSLFIQSHARASARFLPELLDKSTPNNAVRSTCPVSTL